MSMPLFGILQLDRGDPWGYAQLPGLVQAWLQDAGGFAALGLVVYLLYALSTPTDKSESERLRVPVSRWMLLMGAAALICYAVLAALMILGKGAVPPPPPPQPGETVRIDPPAWRGELQALALMAGGLFALLALGEPFARDLYKIFRRNVSLNSSGARRFGRSLSAYSADLLDRNRVIFLGATLVSYLLIGAVLFAVGVPKLVNVWLWLLAVGAGVVACALALLMLFEAEGPVWAIAKLSFKEAVRSQLLWVFLIVLVPFLFPAKWYMSIKPADELRTTTALLTTLLSVLVLVPAGLLAAFGIPNDIKNLNIFTVVSKPVERFEIVLGRFVGYLALMTLVLIGLTGVSAVLITNTGISEQAREETYKARVPHRGRLEFKSFVAQDRTERKEFEGTNVGREFDYRRYIAGAPESPQRAIWKYADLPAEFARAEGDKVPVEFTFDVYKLTKGEQDAGVAVNFTVFTHNAPLRQPTKKDGAEWPWVNTDAEQDYRFAVGQLRNGQLIDPGLADALRDPPADREVARKQARQAGRMRSLADKLKANGVGVTESGDGRLACAPVNVYDARPGTPAWAALSALTEEFGFFELKGKRVFDYKVMGIEVPAGLFRNAAQGDPGKDGNRPLPRLTVHVKCESPGQLLGMAEPDLYLLRNEQPFAVNYFKSMVGLWCRLALVIGVAVAASTYLSGILGFLLTAGIYMVGFFTDHLNDLATGRNIGGPLQSMSQLLKAEQPTVPISDTATARAVIFGDKIAAWFFRRFQNIIPDVESFSWGHFVSEGFNINTEYLVLNVLVTAGYLLPWAIVAYYLMKSREVAA